MKFVGRIIEQERLSRPLAKLIDLGYLEKDIPFGASQKGNKKSLYRIADPFLSFHYKFVPANRSFIELGRKAVIEEQLDRRLPEFIGVYRRMQVDIIGERPTAYSRITENRRSAAVH